MEAEPVSKSGGGQGQPHNARQAGRISLVDERQSCGRLHSSGRHDGPCRAERERAAQVGWWSHKLEPPDVSDGRHVDARMQFVADQSSVHAVVMQGCDEVHECGLRDRPLVAIASAVLDIT
jgi:hypothetical protein